MDKETMALWNDVRKGIIDINNQQLFFSIVAKGFIYKLNQNLKLRGLNIPHYILNTGDDIMFLEVKGQNHAVEPLEVSNENFVYSQIPRCMVQPTGINVQLEQLSNPYSHGKFEVEYNDMVYGLRAEFRRIPVTYGFSLKYYLDNFIDSLDVIQQILSNLSFVNLFKVIYLGQQINCSYQIPDSYQTEYMMEFDGITTDSKYRTISLELEVSTNFPVLHEETVMPADMFIKETVFGIPNITRNSSSSGSGSSGGGSGSGSGGGDEGGSGGSGGGDEGGSSSIIPDPDNPSDIKQVTFRHGIILHSKGGLDTEPGEISSEETVEINPES